MFSYYSMDIYPLVNIEKAIDSMAIEIVDLPSYKMVIFHSYVAVYQRVIVDFWLPCKELIFL
jgi:hypothetical protein